MSLINRLSPKNKLLKNFSVLTLSNALTQFLFIFTSIKIARALDPVLFGTYNLLQLHIAIVTVIASFGLRNIIIRTIARNKTTLKTIFLTGLKIKVAGFIVALILFCAYYFFYSRYDTFLFVLVIICIFSASMFDLFESIAFGLEKMEFSGIINFLSALFWLTTILIIPKASLSLHIILGLFVLFSVLKTIVYFFSIYKTDYIEGFSNESVGKAQIIEFSKESFPYYYLALFTLLSNQIPLLFLEYRSGVEQIGFFNIASKILMPINLVLTTALAALFPNLSRLFVSNFTQFIKNVKFIFLLIALFSITGAFAVTLFRQEVIQLLYGAKYSNSSLVLGYQCWYIAIYSEVCLIGTILGAINRQKELSYLSILCTVIQVPILWYGSKFGAQYLSAAFFTATAINFIIHIYVVNNYLQKNIGIDFYFKVVALYLICYAISLLTPVSLNFYYKLLIFLGIITIGFFVIYFKYKTVLINLVRKNQIT